MNLKTLIALFLLPLSAFGFTNKIDNLWVPGNFRYSTGAAAGSVFTSDAAGNASWAVAGGAAGDVFTNGFAATKLNLYNTSVTNDFRLGPVHASTFTVNTNTAVWSSIFGSLTPDGRVTIRPLVSATLGNIAKTVSIVGTLGAGATPADLGITIYVQGGRGVAYTAEEIQYNTGAGVPFEILDGSNVVGLRLSSSFDAFVTNHFGKLLNTETTAIYGKPVFISSNLVINGNTTIGSLSSDTITANASTMAIPNSLNIGSSALYITNTYGIAVGGGGAVGAARITATGAAGIRALRLYKDGVYTSENSTAIELGDAVDTVGMNIGVDTNLLFTYIQSLDPATSFTSRPLMINPNGGGVNIFGTNGPSSRKLQVNDPVTAAPTADVMINASVSNQVPLFIQGKAGQTVNVLTIEDSAGVDLTTVSSSGRLTTQALTVNATTSGSAINTTSINGQALRVGAGTVAGTNTVLVGTPGNIAPQLIIQSTNGASYIEVNGVGTISIGTNTVSALPFRAILTASNTLDFGNILAAASADLTMTVSGARANDSIAQGLPTAPDPSIVFDYFVSADNTVTVRAHNVGSLAVDQAAQVHRATVIKH